MSKLWLGHSTLQEAIAHNKMFHDHVKGKKEIKLYNRNR